MKAKELIKKDRKELLKILQDLRLKLIDLRFKFSANKLKNVKDLSNCRKDIAKVSTILKIKDKELNKVK